MAIERLIILPCHSIWKGGETSGEDQEEWFLAPFQYEGQDHLAFRDHVQQSFNQLKSNPESILVFSGGRTKLEAGPKSEAESYHQLLKEVVNDDDHSLLEKVVLEEFARDSFENVLFLLCRFYEVVGKYPKFITVVGFEFKKQRFLEIHLAEALKFPIERVLYIGNAPTPGSQVDQERYFQELEAAENDHALSHFRADFFGTRHPLSTKRNSRNPFGTTHKYAESNPQLKSFLEAITNTDNQLTSLEIQKKLKIVW